MKTTMILPDQLMQKARLYARKNHTTMTRLVEDALRSYLGANNNIATKKPWKIEPAGKGGFVSQDLEGNWSKIRDLLYERDQ